MTDPLRPDLDPAADTTVTPTPPTIEPVAPPLTPPAADAISATAAATTSAAPAVPTSPVQVPTAPVSSTSKRTRWLIAGGVVAAVALATVAVTFALTGSSGASSTIGYVPTDSLVYGEARLDLPGDQRAAVGEFLSKFPGFADQAALDSKLDEVLDRIVDEASDGTQTFTTDIKPWFDGEVAFAVGPLPSDISAADPGASARDARGLGIFAIKDAALASAWFEKVLAENGATATTETYNGTEVHVFTPTDSPVAAAYAIIDGKVAATGIVESVKAAIDTNGQSAFADDPDVKAALGAFKGDQVGFLFADVGTLLESATELAGPAASAVPDAVFDLVPDWIGFRMRVEKDALLLDGANPDVEGAPGPDENRANAVADWAPPSTLVLAAGNDYGETLTETLEFFKQYPGLGEAIEGIEDGAGLLGGIDGVVGWLGDTGIVVSQGADAAEGGIVSVPTDPDAAQQLFTQIRTFASLAGGTAGISIREEDHNGTTITIIDLGSLEDLAGLAGAAGEVPGVGPGTIQPGSLPFEGNVELALAATDDVVVIGSGPNFVKSVLDAGAGTSLADDGRYTGLVDRAGGDGVGVTFVDLANIRGFVEGFLDEASAEDRAEYEESIKPFLEPLDALVASSLTGDIDRNNIIITVK